MEPPKKKFKLDNTDDVLAKLESKTKQIDDILAGFDMAASNNKSLSFIPSSINKSSSNKNQSNTNNNKSSKEEITKTITITATSYNIHHHDITNEDAQNAATPSPPIRSTPSISEPIKLRPLPSMDAKPTKSVLRKSQFTTFRDEKRNKRRSK